MDEVVFNRVEEDYEDDIDVEWMNNLAKGRSNYGTRGNSGLSLYPRKSIFPGGLESQATSKLTPKVSKKSVAPSSAPSRRAGSRSGSIKPLSRIPSENFTGSPSPNRSPEKSSRKKSTVRDSDSRSSGHSGKGKGKGKVYKETTVTRTKSRTVEAVPTDTPYTTQTSGSRQDLLVSTYGPNGTPYGISSSLLDGNSQPGIQHPARRFICTNKPVHCNINREILMKACSLMNSAGTYQNDPATDLILHEVLRNQDTPPFSNNVHNLNVPERLFQKVMCIQAQAPLKEKQKIDYIDSLFQRRQNEDLEDYPKTCVADCTQYFCCFQRDRRHYCLVFCLVVFSTAIYYLLYYLEQQNKTSREIPKNPCFRLPGLKGYAYSFFKKNCDFK